MFPPCGRLRVRVWVCFYSIFSRLPDEREPWRILYALSEVLLLLTCATIAC